MDENKLKGIVEEVVNKAVDPIKEDLAELKGSHEELKSTVGELKYTLEERVLPSVTYIETNIKAYKDSYQINNSNAKKLEKRVETLEENVGINPPPELTLAEVN